MKFELSTCMSWSAPSSSRISSSSFRNNTYKAKTRQDKIGNHTEAHDTPTTVYGLWEEGSVRSPSSLEQNLVEPTQRTPHLLGGASPWPVLDESLQHGDGRVGVLLDVLDDAVAQLLVVHGHALGLVQRQQRLLQELQDGK